MKDRYVLTNTLALMTVKQISRVCTSNKRACDGTDEVKWWMERINEKNPSYGARQFHTRLFMKLIHGLLKRLRRRDVNNWSEG